MLRYFKRTLSIGSAVCLLGYAVMSSAGLAESPYRHTRHENAFDGPPVGHPEKALLFAPGSPPPAPEAWQRYVAERWPEVPQPPEPAAFDWMIDSQTDCSKCGFRDAHVRPVVMDVPDWIGPSDATAIETIKRKLGLNAFRGSIFDGAETPSKQLLQREAPLQLMSVEPTCDRCNDACSCPQTVCAASEVNSECHVTAAADDDCPGATHSSEATSAAPPAPLNVDSQPAVGPDPVAVLRQGSAELDELAHRLEKDDRYSEADAVRQAAHQLRLTARELKRTNVQTALRDAPPWNVPCSYVPGPYSQEYGSSSRISSAYGSEIHDE